MSHAVSNASWFLALLACVTTFGACGDSDATRDDVASLCIEADWRNVCPAGTSIDLSATREGDCTTPTDPTTGTCIEVAGCAIACDVNADFCPCGASAVTRDAVICQPCAQCDPGTESCSEGGATLFVCGANRQWSETPCQDEERCIEDDDSAHCELCECVGLTECCDGCHVRMGVTVCGGSDPCNQCVDGFCSDVCTCTVKEDCTHGPKCSDASCVDGACLYRPSATACGTGPNLATCNCATAPERPTCTSLPCDGASDLDELCRTRCSDAGGIDGYTACITDAGICLGTPTPDPNGLPSDVFGSSTFFLGVLPPAGSTDKLATVALDGTLGGRVGYADTTDNFRFTIETTRRNFMLRCIPALLDFATSFTGSDGVLVIAADNTSNGSGHPYELGPGDYALTVSSWSGAAIHYECTIEATEFP